jgi:hypothetical protein
MELVEGQTLAQRIDEGAIPENEALTIARQIADALAAAHEKGIVHRDLKPGNIKIKPDGAVKVLDFGLAKIGGSPSVQSEDSPTISMAATQAGVILGTAAYMSPEQARGKTVDKRTDIWAFGVVVFEILTGTRLFQGADVTETLAGVIKGEPHWNQVPARFRPLLRKCLEKDPRNRLQDIGDIGLLLDNATHEIRPAMSKLPWAVAGILAAALIVLAVLSWRSTPAIERPLVRLDVDLGSDLLRYSLAGVNVVISPDGNRIAYVSQNRFLRGGWTSCRRRPPNCRVLLVLLLRSSHPTASGLRSSP